MIEAPLFAAQALRIEKNITLKTFNQLSSIKVTSPIDHQLPITLSALADYGHAVPTVEPPFSNSQRQTDKEKAAARRQHQHVPLLPDGGAYMR